MAPESQRPAEGGQPSRMLAFWASAEDLRQRKIVDTGSNIAFGSVVEQGLAYVKAEQTKAEVKAALQEQHVMVAKDVVQN